MKLKVPKAGQKGDVEMENVSGKIDDKISPPSIGKIRGAATYTENFCAGRAKGGSTQMVRPAAV